MKRLAASVISAIGLISVPCICAKAAESITSPSPTLSKLQSAKTIVCQTTSTTYFSDGTTSFTEREVTRRLVTKRFRGKDELAFEYTYRPAGFKNSQKTPSPRFDYVSQEADGSIFSLAHEYGFSTSHRAAENPKLEERKLIFLPGKLEINKTWVGDSATIVDVDQMKSTVTGIEWIDGAPTWIITQQKMDTIPTSIRGIRSLEIVYNLNPVTLSTTWVFSYGTGTKPKSSDEGPKDFKFLYYARCT